METIDNNGELAPCKMSLRSLTKIYQNNEGVRDINLNIRENEIITLLGPSGCGKTTILRILGGFLKPDSGAIILNGQDVVNIPPEKRPTAMVFQNYNLWPHMTIFGNLSFGLRLRKINKKQIEREVAEVLELVKMPGTEKKYPSQLSGGQQQRVAIARCLLLKPSVLLLDEPFSALDAGIRLQMREELKRIQRESRVTVVFVTHDQEEAMSISNRIVVMRKGEIAQVGTAQEVYDRPANPFVANFIGSMNFLADKTGGLIAVRPENIQLQKSGNGDLDGVIESVTVLGHYLEIQVKTAQGVLKMYNPRSQLTPQAGNRVGLRFL
ncbi:MAG: ABC transporter ATP-binding protein, partial [Deltaproteobacteria bacterium]|nr:ABC transporter ATP-binding protein [Deltaproteobacteria bacterium]